MKINRIIITVFCVFCLGNVLGRGRWINLDTLAKNYTSCEEVKIIATKGYSSFLFLKMDSSLIHSGAFYKSIDIAAVGGREFRLIRGSIDVIAEVIGDSIFFERIINTSYGAIYDTTIGRLYLDKNYPRAFVVYPLSLFKIKAPMKQKVDEVMLHPLTKTTKRYDFVKKGNHYLHDSVYVFIQGDSIKQTVSIEFLYESNHFKSDAYTSSEIANVLESINMDSDKVLKRKVPSIKMNWGFAYYNETYRLVVFYEYRLKYGELITIDLCKDK